ncbi:MAG: hypothetical protein O7B99_04135, partial [Planctomycetota bacterium]|nr:hypothetical protein [Planctomycetota bacterium]
WITDGTELVAVVPGPPLPITSCPSDAVVVSGPFPLPLVGGPATALAYDPSTDALWFTDDAGFVTHVTKSGAVGALGSFDATAGACGLTPNLRAITVDTAQAPGTLYVSDENTVAYVDAAAGGAAASTTFYTPFSCFTPLGNPIQGLIYAATGNLFGSASDGIFPIIGHEGQSIVPNPSFAISVAGANGGATAFLMLSTSFLCPAGSIFGVPQNIALPAQQVATGTVAPTGLFTAPVPLPPTAPLGLTIFVQWGLFEGSGVWTSTRGMSMTTSRF